MTWIVPSAWSPDGKDILGLFTAKGGTNQIGLVSVSDGSLRVLKSLDWRYPGKMNFSPDGRSIVYDFRPKEESPQRDIFVLASDGSREIPLVKHPADDYLLGWSPEGRWILFASDRRGSWDAWAIEVADGKPQGAPALVKLGIGEINPQRRLLLPPLERGHLGSLHRHDRPDNRQSAGGTDKASPADGRESPT